MPQEVAEECAATYHMACAVVLPAHLFPLLQIILQQVPDLCNAVAAAVGVAVLMTRWVAARVGAIVAAVAIVMGLCYRPGVILLALAMVLLAILQLSLVVDGDIVYSSAGLN